MKRFKLVMVISFIFALTQIGACYAQKLTPLNFNDMYELADDGNLTALKKAMARGLNIESRNSDGDTGICVAIIKNDKRAYNTFVAAGAIPKPPCLYRIDTQEYEDFIDSMFIYNINQNIYYGGKF